MSHANVKIISPLGKIILNQAMSAGSTLEEIQVRTSIPPHRWGGFITGADVPSSQEINQVVDAIAEARRAAGITRNARPLSAVRAALLSASGGSPL